MNSEPAGPIDNLKADISLCRKRMLKLVELFTALEAEEPSDGSWAKLVGGIKALTLEAANNTYPLFDAVCDQIAEVDDVVQEVLEQQESYIAHELVVQIVQTVTLGAALAEELTKLLPDLDDLTKKRIQELVSAYEHSAEVTVIGVNSAAVEDGGDGEDDAEDESDEESNEGEEDATPTPTPAEIPSKKKGE